VPAPEPGGLGSGLAKPESDPDEEDPELPDELDDLGVELDVDPVPVVLPEAPDDEPVEPVADPFPPDPIPPDPIAPHAPSTKTHARGMIHLFIKDSLKN
jgi:hypothetical protein